VDLTPPEHGTNVQGIEEGRIRWRVLITTAAGGTGMRSTPAQWDRVYWEGKHLLMISAINGLAWWHSEVPLLCDIVLAADNVQFQDSAHFANGTVPGLLPRAWALVEQLAQRPSLLLRYTRVLFTQPLKRQLIDHLGHGLALEGMSVVDRTVTPGT